MRTQLRLTATKSVVASVDIVMKEVWWGKGGDINWASWNPVFKGISFVIPNFLAKEDTL